VSLGDLQARNLVTAGGLFEGLPAEAAVARYVDYALNAPAWATLLEQRGMRWSKSTYWSGRDLRYFLAVGVMWYVVGLWLDHKLNRTTTANSNYNRMSARVFAIACATYGIFVCSSVLRGYGTGQCLWFVVPKLTSIVVCCLSACMGSGACRGARFLIRSKG
jgi:hypothetical protein